MKLTVPTWLTLLRIVLIPVLVVVFYLPYKWTSFAASASRARRKRRSMAWRMAA